MAVVEGCVVAVVVDVVVVVAAPVVGVEAVAQFVAVVQ